MKHNRSPPQRHRWVIVAASFLMALVCLGFLCCKSLYLAHHRGSRHQQPFSRSMTVAAGFLQRPVSESSSARGCEIRPQTADRCRGLRLSHIASMLLLAPMRRTSICFIWAACCCFGLCVDDNDDGRQHRAPRWCPAHAEDHGLILAANGVGAAVATQIIFDHLCARRRLWLSQCL